MKKRLNIILIGIVVIIILISIYLIGYRNGQHSEDNPQNQQTFYASIKDITANYLLVEGLEVNDINYRSEFTFSLSENTKLLWRGEKIDPSALKIDDHIAITFQGEVLESYPAQLTEVIKIELLDDEK